MSQRTKGAICALMAALLTVGAAVAFCTLVSMEEERDMFEDL